MFKTILALSLHVNKWGAERSMCEAMSYLQANGFRVIMLITSHGQIEELLKKYNIEYYITPLNSLVLSCHLSFLRRIKSVMYQLFLCAKNDKKIYRLLKDKSIVPDFVYTNTLIPLNGLFISRHYKAKHLLHIREFMQEDFNFYFSIGDRFYLWILRHNIDLALCISKAIYTKFSKSLYGKARLLYNGVGISDKKINTEKPPYISLVFVGRLSEEKGIESVVYSIHNLVKQGINNIHLDIWGEGPLRAKLQDYVISNGLEMYVRLCGYADNVNLCCYDVGIMSSRCEGFGRTTVEYMLSKLAVIGYNGGATPELVIDGVNGFIYRNEDELVSVMRKALLIGRQTLSEMGRKGEEIAESSFSQEKYLSNMLDAFELL